MAEKEELEPQEDEVQVEEMPDVDGQELFEGEPEEVKAEAEATPEQTEEQAEKEKSDRERDERGRFKAKEAEEEAPREERDDHRIPLRELLDEREKRQQIQAQFEAMQQQIAQRQAWEAQQQQQAAQQQQMVDIFENPEWYQQQIVQMPQQIQQYVNRQLAMMRMETQGNQSLMMARSADPETFQSAWEELEKRTYGGDGSWRQAVLTSPDPGATLVSLYKRENVQKRVGDDPDAFIEKTLEEKLNDPDFLVKALERARKLAGEQPKRTYKGPTSLTKAGGGGQSYASGDMSDSAMWEETMR